MESVSIRDQLKAARDELLDLSLRNRLLNFRTLRSRGVRIIDELPREVFRILVREEKGMSFLPKPEDEAEEKEESEEALPQPEEEEGPADRHMDTKLQTPYTSKRLQTRLLNTFYTARHLIEEQGVNVLYLALGMLEWYEVPTSDTVRRAPLLLVPVELTRTSVQARFRLTYSGEEVGDNLSLQAKMKADFALRIPELAENIEDIEVDAYFDAVSEAVRAKRRWHVDRGAIELGFFSFGRFLMFNDLDPDRWPGEKKPSEHPVIRRLLGEGFPKPEDRLTNDDHLDEHLPPDEVDQVVNSDSSQTLALLDVKQGHNLVIQGPPGTGKSQTITNLIAEAIGRDQTVLFVSEKMAALEVVKRRLDKVCLGVACLELHSHKTAKKEVLEELERTLRLGKPQVEDHAADVQVLLDKRRELNTYCHAVNTPIGESGVPPFEAYGQLFRFRDRLEGVNVPRLETGQLHVWTREEQARREELVKGMQAHLKQMGVPAEHPFWGSRREAFWPAEEQDVREAAQGLTEATGHLQASAQALAEALGLEVPEDRKGADILCRAARRAIEAPNLEGVTLDTSRWRTQRGRLETLLEAGKRYAALHAKHDKVLIPEAWQADVLEVRQHLSAHGEKWYRLFIGDWRRAKSQLAGLCKESLPKRAQEHVVLADAILEAQRKKQEIDQHTTLAEELFGVQWQGTDSDWEVLERLTEWVLVLYEDIEEGELPSGLIGFLSGSPELDRLDPLVGGMEETLEKHAACIETFVAGVELDAERRFGTGQSLDGQPFTVQEEMARCCAEQVARLQEMVVYGHREAKLYEEDLGFVAQLAASWPQASDYLTDAFQQVWFNTLVEQAMEERPVLARFDGAGHEQAVQSFRERDEAMFAHNRVALALSHWKSLPRHGGAGQVGVLRHEFHKKRRHLPIRRLIEKAGRAIQRIKPVFMMSPMSVAKYLPPDSVSFDLVVFDEASQVRPVDAFGSILRGTQVVVVGDTKQLPPTSFFDTMLASDDAETTTADLESILGLFNAQGAPERMLRWHYRSRHESLIAVSNQEFYDNNLVIFPSPDADRKELGVRYHHLPDTHYDRGGSRTNKGEAHRVAEAVMEHARVRPDWTLGVATFSTAQMQAVLDQLELLRRKDPSCEPFFNGHEEEPFFVKNLENVQGDERDVIYISVGYGRDQNGRLTMNFGPLNRDGGERRLNVLVTRARRRCEVFTNLRAEDIDLSRADARGVEVLKRYLKYADSGEMDLAVPMGRGADPPFEEAVAKVLREAGCQVVHQVGVAGFRIDLAVKDPQVSGRYLLGVECDGATYHSARTARDRDRIRQSVLEGLGWTIHRIWSTDWFRNPDRELKKTIAAVERAKARHALSTRSRQDGTGTSEEMIIERAAPAREEPTVLEVPAYVKARLDGISTNGQDLHEVSTVRLAGWLKRVVETEGPVHFDDAVRRVMASCGVTRLGRRIRESFRKAARYADRQNAIVRKGDFLFPIDQAIIPVRDRSELPASERDIRHIAPAEIAAAVERVVEASIGITLEEASAAVCQLLGFSRVSGSMQGIVQDVLDSMIREGRLRRDGAHLMIHSEE